MDTEIYRVHIDDSRVIELHARQQGLESIHRPNYVFSTIPLPILIQQLSPDPPAEVLSASRNLRYRSFVVVNLIVDKPDVFTDNWIYVHAPHIRAGRIQNYKNWSPYMVPDPSSTSLGVEYFVQEGDEMWNLQAPDLVQLASKELQEMGLIDQSDVRDGFVLKIPNVYPIYGPDYRASLTVIREYLKQIKNLQVMGRAGLFRYDNSDHAILCGLYAARNALGAKYDLWSINTEAAHHEEYQATEFY